MDDKTKKIVERAGWITTAAGIVALLVCGVTTDEINSGVALIDVAVTAVGAAIAFILGKMKNKK